MGGWVGWQKLITFLAKSLDIRGECINDGLELASSFCIKEDIEDINDDTELNMILVIEPKTCKYIDKVTKGDEGIWIYHSTNKGSFT